MIDSTKIEWTDASWNPVTGCSKVSQGCKNCYAEREWVRLSANPKTVYHGRKFTDVQCHPERLEQPLRWKKPRRIFVNSMSDLFHERVPNEYIAAIFGVMAAAERHSFQVLTKRPRRAREWFRWAGRKDGGARLHVVWEALAHECTDGFPRHMHSKHCAPPEGPWPLPNVWLGVSAEDQATADERIPILLETPAAVRFISAEPLLGKIYLNGYTNLDWVIAGGESGPAARPSNPNWFRALRDQCSLLEIPYHFKQWGEWAPSSTLAPNQRPNRVQIKFGMVRSGKKRAGRELDGRTWDGYPS